jgi:valyl-tRNA synthetase
VTSQTQSIRSLCGKGISAFTILGSSEPRPTGCVAFPVSSAASVFLHVKGRVDIDGEISQAVKKLERTRAGIERQRKILDNPNYKDKVKPELQEVEKRKLSDLEMEHMEFEITIKQFEALKAE